MTKADIISEISTKTGIEKVDVQETVEAFFKVIKNSMIGGENQLLSLSILFQALNQQNIRTKQVITIGAVLLLIAFLFTRDIKGLVKPKQESPAAPAAGQLTSNTAQDINLQEVSATGKNLINPSLAAEITKLENAYKSAPEDDKAAVAAQLAQKWDDVEQTVPSALYLEIISKQQKSLQSWLNTGGRFMKAFDSSRDSLMQPLLLQKANMAYTNAMAIDSANAEAKTGLGITIVNGMGMPMKGIAMLLEVVKKDPSNLKANMSLGTFAIKSGQFDKAIVRFNDIIAKKPSPDAYFYLATAYESLGKNKEAIAAYLNSKKLAANPTLSKFIDKKVAELKLHKEHINNNYAVGDIYLGRIKKIMPGLNAAFVDVGYEKDAFLHYFDLGPQVQSLIKLTKIKRNGSVNGTLLDNFKLEADINKAGKISDVVTKNMVIPVQIAKEPISTKGPRLSSDLSIAGRYIVLVPFSNVISISKKIKSNTERNRLKKIIESIKPKNFGVIIRTVSEGKGVAELQKDLLDSVAKWENFIKKLPDAEPSKRVWGEMDRTSTLIRDILSTDFTNVYVNDHGVYEDIRSYVHEISPEMEKIVKHYKQKEPIFEHFGLDKQIKNGFGKTVNLAGGAYLVVEHTEALHVIDVNSGNRTASKENQEENALQVNKEAAKEIARQLRLRDMGGIVVIDFIDMHKPVNRKMLFDYLRELMQLDRAKHTILPPSKFGLVQITRQRVRPEMNIVTSEKCPTCDGTGEIKASIVLMDDIENNLTYILQEQNEKNITLCVHPYIEAYIKKGFISLQWKWFFKFGQRIKIKAVASYNLTEFHFLSAKDEEINLCFLNSLKLAKTKSAYFCQNCGYESAKWLGKCPSCNQWNTFVEELVEKQSSSVPAWKTAPGSQRSNKPNKVENIESSMETRIPTGDQELDRVLGGGLVTGSVTLIGGEPGIGKSTLMLQLALNMTQKRILYISGEESEQQIKMRAERITTSPKAECYILTETSTQNIFKQIQQLDPELVIVDSIQTLHSSQIESTPGSVSQVRECTAELLRFAKETNTPVFLIGHITKDGAIAGPKILEHMVDTVLQFEGDRHHIYRILRSIKNRFGAAAELGIYAMNGNGLREVTNPSEILLSQRDEELSGIAISATLEGARPMLIETQALVSVAAYGTPQRSATGFDTRRMNMLLAVLEKRCGFRLSTRDVFLNIAGGIKVEDPAIDLAVLVAIISSHEDISVSSKICFAAEVGLSGEIRAVNRIDQRISEADKLGFERIFVSRYNMKGLTKEKYSLEIIGVSKIEDVFTALFGSDPVMGFNVTIGMIILATER
eukprot:gene13178-15487_t